MGRKFLGNSWRDTILQYWRLIGDFARRFSTRRRRITDLIDTWNFWNCSEWTLSQTYRRIVGDFEGVTIDRFYTKRLPTERQMVWIFYRDELTSEWPRPNKGRRLIYQQLCWRLTRLKARRNWPKKTEFLLNGIGVLFIVGTVIRDLLIQNFGDNLVVATCD
jgi:hypothetical protein